MPALVLLVLGMGQEANAQRKVDWSQYLEAPGSYTKPTAAPTQQRVRSPAKAQKSSRSVAKKDVAKKKRVKARATSTSRSRARSKRR